MSSRRKHYKQMSKRERDFLTDTLLRLPALPIKKHCLDRMREKGVSEKEIHDVVRFGTIIECHNNVSNDIRLLVRHDRRNVSISVVVSLREKRIVTTYPNDLGDKHFTLDWANYKWTVDIEDEVKRKLTLWGRKPLSKIH